jgi:GTPase SAR1 family protein
LLVFSIDNKKSFNDLDGWLSELKDNGDKDVKIALVGNKTDLDKREVSKEEELEYKIKRNLDLCFESSAKHGDNSKDIFIEGAKLIYNEHLKNKKNEEKNKNLKIKKDNNNKKKKKNKKNKNEKLDEDYDYNEYDEYDDYDDMKGKQGSCNNC